METNSVIIYSNIEGATLSQCPQSTFTSAAARLLSSSPSDGDQPHVPGLAYTVKVVNEVFI